MIQITRASMLDNVERTMEIPLTVAQYEVAMHDWQVEGVLIQEAFPTLTAEQREFIKTGITGDQWAQLFGADDSEE